MTKINEELINALKHNTPGNSSTVSLLMNIIPIGKEAAYRRLRGDIPFTLEEVAVICVKLNLSLDLLIGTRPTNAYAFQLNAVFSEHPLDEYSNMLKEIIEIAESIKTDTDSFSYRAYKTLPQDLLFQYDVLSKIYLYIVYYQLYPEITPKRFSDINIPDSIFALQKQSAKALHEIGSVIIFDKHIFADYVEIVKYIRNLDMISSTETDLIKAELHLMLDDLERYAVSGLSMQKKKLEIYIAQVGFDCSYYYFQGAGLEASVIGMYCLDNLSCYNPKIAKNQKKWIKSLMRFSTLISESGELQRNNYFLAQRNIVDML